MSSPDPSAPETQKTFYNPLTGEELIAPAVAEKATKDHRVNREGDEKMGQLLAQGWRRQTELADEMSMDRLTLIGRRMNIDPNADYRTDGLKPSGQPGEKIIKGKELSWTHPYDFHYVLINPEYAQGMLNAEKKAKVLEAKGYILQSDEKIKWKMGNTFRQRVDRIEPDQTYLLNGLSFTGATGEETIKGSELVWRNPYSMKTVLLHPTFVQAMRAAEAKQEELQKQGYRLQYDVAADAEMKTIKLAEQTAKIDPHTDYRPNGLLPIGKEGETTVKGSELVWHHPYSMQIILLHPEYAQGKIEAEKKQRQLEKQGYRPAGKAASDTGIHPVMLNKRNIDIDPDQPYLSSGLPADSENEATIKGAELVWRHPYAPKAVVLMHPDYIAGVKASMSKQKELSAAGYLEQAEIVKKSGRDGTWIHRRVRNIAPDHMYLQNGQNPTGKAEEKTISGSELVWRHPYTPSIVLLHPEFASALLSSARGTFVTKGAKATSLGEATELPSDIQESLDTPPKPQQEM